MCRARCASRAPRRRVDRSGASASASARDATAAGFVLTSRPWITRPMRRSRTKEPRALRPHANSRRHATCRGALFRRLAGLLVVRHLRHQPRLSAAFSRRPALRPCCGSDHGSSLRPMPRHLPESTRARGRSCGLRSRLFRGLHLPLRHVGLSPLSSSAAISLSPRPLMSIRQPCCLLWS